jgi:hypothetical protein
MAKSTMLNQKPLRLRTAELISAMGALVLGGGLGAVLAERLRRAHPLWLDDSTAQPLPDVLRKRLCYAVIVLVIAAASGVGLGAVIMAMVAPVAGIKPRGYL